MLFSVLILGLVRRNMILLFSVLILGLVRRNMILRSATSIFGTFRCLVFADSVVTSRIRLLSAFDSSRSLDPCLRLDILVSDSVALSAKFVLCAVFDFVLGVILDFMDESLVFN